MLIIQSSVLIFCYIFRFCSILRLPDFSLHFFLPFQSPGRNPLPDIALSTPYAVSLLVFPYFTFFRYSLFRHSLYAPVPNQLYLLNFVYDGDLYFYNIPDPLFLLNCSINNWKKQGWRGSDQKTWFGIYGDDDQVKAAIQYFYLLFYAPNR